MNIFTQIATEINREVNQLEENINDTIDNVKGGVRLSLLTKDSPELGTILADLMNGNEVYGMKPEDIVGFTNEDARNYILAKGIFNKVEVDVPEGDNPVVEMNQDEPNNNIEDAEKTQEETQEMLEDPQISGIFDELRSEFPEPTSTPAPLNTGRLITREPTISVNIEGFENIPLPTAVRVNNHLKQQFVENFKF